MKNIIKTTSLCSFAYNFGSYPIENPDNDPCSNTYDPFYYLSPRGDHIEPISDKIYSSDNGFGLDLAAWDILSGELPIIFNDIIPISRLSGVKSPTDYRMDSLEDYVHTVWDPYQHDYVPAEEAKTPQQSEIQIPKTPFYPEHPSVYANKSDSLGMYL